ncbi:MAG TPA: hypothetical protein PK295_03700 [Candidatus Magasanikbacteria bacterium]|nr:hypothetical protein [Candidatus Magasanikbacteria bacterium]
MFPSQLVCIVIYLFTFNLYTGCVNPSPPEQLQMSSIMPASESGQSTSVSNAQKTEEVLLDPTIINAHASIDTGSNLGIISEDSEEAACKMAGGFLVVPLLSEESTYLNCGDQRDAIYVMKLVNCSKQKITFTKFNFTVTLVSNQGETAEAALANEFAQFELYVDNDQSSYMSMFKSVDRRSGLVPFADPAIEVEAGEEQYCRLKAIRRCTGVGDRLELILDLTGAVASKNVEKGVYVNGAVFNKPDRQVTFMSRN